MELFTHLRSWLIRYLIIALSIFVLGGCSSLYTVVGKGASNFGQDVMMPYLLTTKDMELACSTGESLGPVLASLGQYTTDIQQLKVLTNLIAGLCAHEKAQEANLEFIRLAKIGQITVAQDARTQSKRLHTLAADRQYNAYLALRSIHGEIGNKCPMFSSENDELTWVLGTMAAVQSVLSDTAGGGEIGVPKKLAPRAIRAASCLDTVEGNQRWWGLPKAIIALLSSILPGAGEKGVDQWEQMAIAVQIGEDQGVRISRALMAVGAENAGKIDLLKNLIRDQANSIKQIAPSHDFRLLDSVATVMIIGLSDILWTEAEGHRTPHGALGTFWDDVEDNEGLDIDFGDL